MSPTFWIRIAAVSYAFFGLGHTAGMFTPSRGLDEARLFAAMRAYGFDAMGVQRTHWDFYHGFGWYLCVLTWSYAVLLTLVASLARRDGAAAAPFVATLLLASCASTALCVRYFFAAPAITSVAATIALTVAMASLIRQAMASSVATAPPAPPRTSTPAPQARSSGQPGASSQATTKTSARAGSAGE